ncbi:hypothetical protein QYM36_014875, partial [Artemia franciscana]
CKQKALKCQTEETVIPSTSTTFFITQSMAGVVKSMDSAMKSMNLEKISGLNDKFESQFEDFDVQSSYIEGRCHRQQQCPLHRVRLIVQLCKLPTKQGLLTVIP